MKDVVKIGALTTNRVWLAPMAGYTDIAFRTLAKEYGAGLTVTEMTSVRGFVHGGEVTRQIARVAPCETPSCVQLFGNDPSDFYVAAKALDCDIIDINMGCPMPKIVKNGDGAALMNDPKLAGDIVRAVKDAANKPVTVKTRLGYRLGERTAGELIERVAESGCELVTVHGRYAEQRYEGECDFGAIEELKKYSPIPIAASGDVTRKNLEWALGKFYAVMIGRGALSDIGVFSGAVVDPTDVARRHVELLTTYFDERYTVNQARKFFVHYFKGAKGARTLRNEVNTAERVSDVLTALEKYKLGIDNGAQG